MPCYAEAALQHNTLLGLRSEKRLPLQTSLADWPVCHLSLDPVDSRRAAFVLANGWAGGQIGSAMCLHYWQQTLPADLAADMQHISSMVTHER
jgi:hypothetical protein